MYTIVFIGHLSVFDFYISGQLSASQDCILFILKIEVWALWTTKRGIDADEHRRVILQKAQTLFVEQGLDNVSMHQIAKSAGVGQGTLYRRYAHKGELISDIMQESCSRICDEIKLYMAASVNKPIRERMEQVFQFWLDFLEMKSQWLEAIQAPASEGRRTIINRTPLYQSMHSAISELLSETALMENGLPQNPSFTADVIMASMSPDFYLFLRRDRGYSLAEIKLNILKVYLDPLSLE
jgi:TetR/AcrR family transcriptional repressor of mexAB-oprM operon